MFENSLLWAISTLGITQIAKLDSLLANERSLNPSEQQFASGPAADASYSDLPITVQDSIAFIHLRGIMLKSYPWRSRYVSSSFHTALAIRAARIDSSITDIVIIADTPRSEEHTSELQSRPHLVC